MVADRSRAVMEVVEDAISENPDISVEALQARAAEVDPSVSDLSPRSFNARYPLQVRRRLSQEGSTSSEDSTFNGTRSDIRAALLDFARDVVSAGDRGEVIEVVNNVDDYVGRIMNDD